jgi:hypothetical protein
MTILKMNYKIYSFLSYMYVVRQRPALLQYFLFTSYQCMVFTFFQLRTFNFISNRCHPHLHTFVVSATISYNKTTYISMDKMI